MSERAPTVEDQVFKALADPTRRQILDRLRVEPATTGQVASGFELSRFGVMKHLKILHEAGLLVVEARGRERWHSVNPLPIRSIYHRWMRPFEEQASDQLLRLRTFVEERAVGNQKEEAETMSRDETNRTKQDLGVIHLQVEVEIRATPEAVWTALTDDIGRWWHPAFYTGGKVGDMRLESILGGRMVEEWGEGEGLVWGVVNGLERGRRLEVVNDTSRAWGGPSRGHFSWTLEDAGEGTVVRFEQSQFGVVSEQTASSLDSGWSFLFERCLKPWIEEGQDPATVPYEEECQR